LQVGFQGDIEPLVARMQARRAEIRDSFSLPPRILLRLVRATG
jgi:hypothetical protein